MKKWKKLWISVAVGELICSELNDPTDTSFSDKVEGMNIYAQEQIEQLLKASGFAVTVQDKHERGWLCIIGQKQ